MKKLLLLIVFFGLLAGYAVAQVAEPAAPVSWVDSNFWSLVTGVGALVYEFLALKLPSSKTLSIIGNLYKLITKIVPDKSSDGGNFKIN